MTDWITNAAAPRPGPTANGARRAAGQAVAAGVGGRALLARAASAGARLCRRPAID